MAKNYDFLFSSDVFSSHPDIAAALNSTSQDIISMSPNLGQGKEAISSHVKV